MAATMRPSGARAEGAPGFIRIIPTEGRPRGEDVWLSTIQVVRVARVDGVTVIDTAAWVQQRTIEAVEAVAGRLQTAGLKLLPLTDLNQNRIWLAADRVVAVRDSNARHAPGARAAIIMVGLRYNTDVAVRESVEEVMAMLRGAQPNAP